MTATSPDTWQDESVALARELFAFLQSIDPARWRAELEDAAFARLQELSVRARESAQALSDRAESSPVGVQLAALAALLESAPARTPDPSYEAQWEAFRKRLGEGYEELASTLKRHAVQVPTLRPTNYTRSLVHVSLGLGAMLLVEHVLTPRSMILVSGLCALAAWSMEVSRRYSPRANAAMLKVLGKIAHAHERHRVNSSTWYTTALFLLALTVSPMVCAVAIAVLAFADPFAALIGRRWGSVRIVANRSLQGTLGFFAMGFAVAFAVIRVYHPGVAVGASLAIAACASLTGALAELFSTRLDDNFTVPLSTAAGAVAIAAALGVG